MLEMLRRPRYLKICYHTVWFGVISWDSFDLMLRWMFPVRRFFDNKLILSPGPPLSFACECFCCCSLCCLLAVCRLSFD